MPKLVFDIETIGEDFDSMDSVTKEALTKWIKREANTKEEYQAMLTEVKDGLGFSPLTGEIVVIGVLDIEQDKGVIYFQAPGKDLKEFEEGNFKYKPMSEKEMLKKFWEGVGSYNEFISFNGRSFDVPFIIARSGVNKVPISKDLMCNRYLSGSNCQANHIDLLDQLCYYGAVRRKGSLHLWCRALGIKSPKENGVNGENVTALFKEKKFVEIAKYNKDDLIATRELYEKWRKYMRVGK